MNRFGKLLQDVNPNATEAKPERTPKAEKAQSQKSDAGKVETTETREIIVRRAVGKRSKDDYTQVSAYIPKGTHKKVKAALAADEGRDFSELVSDLLADWLNCRPSA